jgi:hypothetical protein
MSDQLDQVISAGSVVLVSLQQPREKFLGLLLKLDNLGAQLRGIDLNSFDDLISQTSAGCADEGIGPILSTMFIPALRIERILLDEPAGTLPSCGQRFQGRTGIDFAEFLRSR